jgi:hypothetical protein
MKAIISIIALVVAATVLAETTKSDLFNTNIDIKKESIKCSLLARKLKMKLSGLLQLGKFGRKYFKSVRTYNEPCTTIKGRIFEQLDQRRGPLDAKILIIEKEITRTVWRHDRDFRGYDYITENYPVCEKISIKKINIKLTQITLENLPIELKREEEKHLGFNWGPCR